MTTVLVSAEYVSTTHAMQDLYHEFRAPVVICFTKSFDELCDCVNGWEALTPDAFWQQCGDALCMGNSVGYRIQAEAAVIDHLRIVQEEMYQPGYALFVEHFLRSWFNSKGNALEVKMWDYDEREGFDVMAMTGTEPVTTP